MTNPVRYIRLYSDGNSENSSNHVVEIQAFKTDGTNVALNKPTSIVTAGGSPSTTTTVTDGNTSSSNFVDFGPGIMEIEVDLGEIYNDIAYFKFWFYYQDDRTYNDVSFKTSSDGLNFTTIYGPKQFRTRVEGQSVSNTSLGILIESENPVYYFPFNEQFNLAPNNAGSSFSDSSSNTFVQQGGDVTYTPDNRGNAGGSWYFGYPTSNDENYIETDQNILTGIPEETNAEYTVGFWFKMENFGEFSYSKQIFTARPQGVSNSGFQIFVAGTVAGSNTKRIRTDLIDSSIPAYGPELVEEEWNLLVVKFSGSSSIVGTSGSNVTMTLNGQQILSGNSSGSNTSNGSFRIGTGYGNSTTLAQTFYFSDLFVYNDANISENFLSNIYSLGSEIFANVTNTPATASAEIIDPVVKTSVNFLQSFAEGDNAFIVPPTIIAVVSDSVNITTFIQVNAFFPSNYSISASENVFNNVSTSLDASAEFSDLINITSTLDTSFAAESALATAEILQPLARAVPMIASSELIEPSLNIDENLYTLVTNNNPDIYWDLGPSNFVNDGSLNDLYVFNSSTQDKNILTIGNIASVSNGTAWRINDISGLEVDVYESNSGLAGGEYFKNLNDSQDWTIEFWIYLEKEETILQRVPTFLIGTSDFFITTNDSSNNQGNLGDRQEDINLANWSEEGTLKINVEPVDTYISGYKVDPFTGQVTDEPQYANRVARDLGVSLSPNNWHHVSLSQKNNNDGTNQIQVILDGALIFNEGHDNASYVNTNSNDDRFKIYLGRTSGSSGTIIEPVGSYLIDHLALYPQSLEPNTIIYNYNFVESLTPNVNYFSNIMEANAQAEQASVISVFNIIIPVDIWQAIASIENPLVTARKNVFFSSDLFDVFAEAVEPAFFGNPDYNESATPMTAFAEELGGYHLSDLYYEYITQNILPYRYVSFDGANPLSDDGSDTVYSVPPVILNGEVVSPIEGINGRSGKTDSVNYATDGLLLMESEHDDDWGTGTDEYHSSFWVQKTKSDNSTGLRILWNLNGAYDNQHVILYQYQDKLHLNFNNGSGTFIDQSTVNNINLFDGNRHFVVINFDHTGVNNYAKLFIDGFEVMEVDLGTYTGQTINSPNFLPPNDANNNLPRVSVGSLITPFSSTSLPVVPTNTSIYVDEVVWAKSPIDAAEVLTLFNLMPAKINNTYFQTALEASAEIINFSEITTSVNYEHLIFEANSEFLDPDVEGEIPLEYIVENSMLADAEILEGVKSDEVNFETTSMIASGIMNGASVGISIFIFPMEASSELKINLVNGINVEDNVIPQYIRYLISTRQETILPKKEFM